ncbi:MAG: tetratricopeptide repeat protein [Kordiimonadaceae bacterium]|nr:tetratricopeptide repeat protein [Kordiimonadaceae bacterium]
MNYILSRMFTGLTLVVLMASVVVSFFVSASGQAVSEDKEELPFGEYLAGRHALSNNQYDVAAENYLKALEYDPDNVSLNQFTLAILVTDGRFEDAIKIARKLDELDQKSDLSELILFFNDVKQKSYSKALDDVDTISNSGILNLIKPIFKAWIYAGQKDRQSLDGIVATFDEASSFNFFNFFQAGLMYEYLGDLEQAKQYYSKSLNEVGSPSLRAIEAYGKILARIGDKNQAIDVLQGYLDEAPTNVQINAALDEIEKGSKIVPFINDVNDGYAELFYSVATILMQDNVRRVATNYLQYALYFKPDFPLANFLQAQIFEDDKFFEGAEKQLNRISSDSPLYFQTNLQKAWLYNEMELSDKALEAFKALEKQYPDNREVLNALAEFYRTHEQYKEAIGVYDKVVATIDKETERDWILYYTRGIVLDQLKRWDEAERDFKKALEIRPEQPMVMNYLAYSWVDRGKNYVEAKAMLERAVELRPNDGYIVDSLGWALFKMGDVEEAVPVLERAAQLQTQDWAINDHLGDIYWVIGRKNEARFQWRHALSLKPDEDKVDGIKDKIKNGYQ